MFVDDPPLSGYALVAGRHTHPAGLFLTFFVGTAAIGQPVGEGDVVGRGDLDLMEIELVRAGAHFHTGLPMGPVGGLALELQGLDGIERDNVLVIERHDFFDVLGHDGLAIGVDQGLDFGFSGLGIHGDSPQFFVEDTLCRLEKQRIDNPTKIIQRKKFARIQVLFCRQTTDVFVTPQLVPYEDLTALQREQVSAIEIHPEQIKFAGDIHGALHMLLSKPGPGVKGFALLAEEVPVAFLLLKRPPVLPAWANEHSATLHALQVDHRAQGKGYGKACLQALPAVARAAWPEIRGLELSVDADNDLAIGLYTRLGWVDSGEAYKGRIGYERRMGLVF